MTCTSPLPTRRFSLRTAATCDAGLGKCYTGDLRNACAISRANRAAIGLACEAGRTAADVRNLELTEIKSVSSWCVVHSFCALVAEHGFYRCCRSCSAHDKPDVFALVSAWQPRDSQNRSE